MQGEIFDGDQRIPYEFIERPGVRNIYLKFYGEKLVIVAPRRIFRPSKPESIIEKHRDWIVKHHKIVKSRRLIFERNYVSYLGKRYLTVFAEGAKRIEINRDAIVVHADSRDTADRMLERMIREETERLLPQMTIEKAARLGVNVREIKFRRARRWGSCSSKREITFHSYLSALPVDVIDYIAAHEVSHIKEMNHSPAFWAVVETICPEYKRLKKVLSDYDNDLGSVMCD